MEETMTTSTASSDARPSPVTPADRRAAGKRLRDHVPRAGHAAWRAHAGRADPIGILRAADATRQKQLVPLRYGRMLQSPFTFYRGSAGVMAADLAETPASGIHVQVCGDCHLMNFGGFATPERRLLFDINDLDETLPAPWEWDVKRLVASFVRAARANGLRDADGRDAAVACARFYRSKMRDFAAMDVLDIWYARLDDSDFLAMLPEDRKAVLRKRIAKATAASSSELVFPKLVHQAGEQPHIRDTPPTIFHAEASRAAGDLGMVRETLAKYRETLADDRRVLLDRYRLVDAAVKVVGIGSVGTLCMVVLMMSVADHPFFLQVKQANASVLEAYAGKSAYAQHGERVVQGQRLMQPASDLFLGWVIGPEGRHFYIRQLRDAKLSPLVETYDAEMLSIYGKACGWALARAHAKAGDPWMISGISAMAASSTTRWASLRSPMPTRPKRTMRLSGPRCARASWMCSSSVRSAPIRYNADEVTMKLHALLRDKEDENTHCRATCPPPLGLPVCGRRGSRLRHGGSGADRSAPLVERWSRQTGDRGVRPRHH
jgi:uncharacterized protein (DUF2252 family)